jgi:A/G-specific adenine glycosylase
VPATLTLAPALHEWDAASRRDLPWRHTRDPWAVLVSEVMLQQTQVNRVMPKWRDFMTRFPAPADCAAARVGEVVRLWAGLGYNRRALQLHRCAGQLVAGHGGRVPDDLHALLRLAGVGPYTARAVLAFAFERDIGVLDTNAARVLARAVAGRPLRRPEAQHLADALVPPGQGWAWNQSVLDLGATVCRARSPACGSCPLLGACRWAADGFDAPDPAVGSAGTGGRQSAFRGSDREGRGRLVEALRQGPVGLADDSIAAACGWSGQVARARRVAGELVAEGLADVDARAGTLTLPG